MFVIISLLFIVFIIYYFLKPKGYCTECNRSLNLIQALQEAKLIDNQVVCKKCYTNTSSNYSLRDATTSPLPRINHYRTGKETSNETAGNIFSDSNAENAIKSRGRVWIKYVNEHGETSERKVDIYYSKYGYFHGWCNLRNEPRTFKLSNVGGWKLLDENFEWNEDIANRILKKVFES